MTYDSGASLRRALEDRLRIQSLQAGVPLVRLRKMVIFDRFLARLMRDQPDAWILKGDWLYNCGSETGLGRRKTSTCF